MHKIVTDEIQPKQYVSLQMILRRNLVWAKYKGIYRIQAWMRTVLILKH